MSSCSFRLMEYNNIAGLGTSFYVTISFLLSKSARYKNRIYITSLLKLFYRFFISLFKSLVTKLSNISFSCWMLLSVLLFLFIKSRSLFNDMRRIRQRSSSRIGLTLSISATLALSLVKTSIAKVEIVKFLLKIWL